MTRMRSIARASDFKYMAPFHCETFSQLNRNNERRPPQNEQFLRHSRRVIILIFPFRTSPA
ncbi:hypothetical protein BURPS305_7193 [Burkholderia pseudomallei 305]|nr:hypothetical protein BURPS305_7193 [Burkholderia pseudomallei 305]